MEMGFKFQIVLPIASMVKVVILLKNHNQLNFVVAIRSNHSVLMPQGSRVRYTTWKKFNRVFEWRYRRPLHQRNSFGKRRNIRYWQITTDKVELPENTTWFIMTNLPGDVQNQSVIPMG